MEQSLARRRHRWLSFQAAASLLAVVLGYALADLRPAVSFGFGVVSGISFIAVALVGRNGTFRSADWITSIRLAGAVFALCAAGFGYSGLLIVLVLAAAELTDFFDGLVARRIGPSEFGGFWDAEIDAFYIMTVSYLAVFVLDMPLWVAAAGLFRYLFYFLFRALKELDNPPPAFRWYAKSACAVAAVLLTVLFFPSLPGPLRVAISATAVAVLSVSFLWETILRLSPLGESVGLLHSLIVYYALPFRKRRMRRMYGRFVPPGGLVFDIGSHVGNRLRALKSLGAQVVAVEPNPRCVEILTRFYGRSELVTIESVAVGSRKGETTLYVSTSHPTLASASRRWIDHVQRSPLFRGIAWDKEVTVPVTTLDALVEAYGVPDFVKIDVEGMEVDVLKGLSVPVAALSFEFLPAAIESAVSSIDRTEVLGTYEFNYSMVETMKLQLETWVSAGEMRTILLEMPPTGRSGDVYARRAANRD